MNDTRPGIGKSGIVEPTKDEMYQMLGTGYNRKSTSVHGSNSSEKQKEPKEVKETERRKSAMIFKRDKSTNDMIDKKKRSPK